MTTNREAGESDRFTLTCEECSLTRQMQPREACPNWFVQQRLKEEQYVYSYQEHR